MEKCKIVTYPNNQCDHVQNASDNLIRQRIHSVEARENQRERERLTVKRKQKN